MKFSQETADSGYLIQSFEQGSITVMLPDSIGEGGMPLLTTLQQSFIIAPQRLIDDWSPQSLAELQAEDLEIVTELEPEVLLIGSGAQMRFPDPRVLAGMMGRGIGIEVMDSAAACRTYNILAGEGRRVAAAILIQ